MSKCHPTEDKSVKVGKRALPASTQTRPESKRRASCPWCKPSTENANALKSSPAQASSAILRIKHPKLTLRLPALPKCQQFSLRWEPPASAGGPGHACRRQASVQRKTHAHLNALSRGFFHLGPHHERIELRSRPLLRCLVSTQPHNLHASRAAFTFTLRISHQI